MGPSLVSLLGVRRRLPQYVAGYQDVRQGGMGYCHAPLHMSHLATYTWRDARGRCRWHHLLLEAQLESTSETFGNKDLCFKIMPVSCLIIMFKHKRAL